MPNILYIEDDEDLREAVIMALEDAGFTATGAENGMIGLESVRREQPDLVITDVLMPECDGIELIQALAREFPDLPVIAVTGGFKNALGGVPDNRDEIARAAIALGARKTITKPFRLRALLDTMTDLLDGDGAALMKLGAFATIGAMGPDNLVHIILDNGVHDSTGGQPTVSPSVDFAGAALSCGYAGAALANDPDGFEKAFVAALEKPGPHLIHVRIRPGSLDSLGRPTLSPREVADRFKAFLAEPNSTTG